MQILIDATGRVLSCGDLDFAPEEGQTVVATTATLADFAAADAAGQGGGQPYDVTHAAGAFAVRVRAANATEQAQNARTQLAAQLQQAADGWDALTAGQKDAAIKGLLRFAVAAVSQG